MSEEDYNDTLELQEGVCALCLKPETSKRDDGSEQLLAVDHDHATGRIRGLLCQRCNTGLGLFRDDPEALERAAEYVGATSRSK